MQNGAEGAFSAFIGRGRYDVTVQCQVPEGARFTPGELATPEDILAQGTVTPFQREARTCFFLDVAEYPPLPPGDDCDNDGLSNVEEGMADLDGDGLPNACDEDSDADDIPDSDDPYPTTAVLVVNIDIRPKTPLNRLNPAIEGWVPVAVLGSAALNVLDINPWSLRFGVDGDNAGLYYDGQYVDVNEDGQLDLLVNFLKSELGIDPATPVNTVLPLQLTGRLHSKQYLEGSDSIVVWTGSP
jgi:hypothetical protein